MFRPFPSRRRTLTLGAAFSLLAGMILVLIGAPVVAVAADGDAAVTWSVQPADETGPDGRSWAELTVDPGASAVDHLAVHNLSDHEVDFALTAADGFFNQNGRFNILPSDQASTDAGTWIAIADSVTVASGGTVVVPFTVTVPANAQPGDHAAGVAASILTPSTTQGGATVGVESRVGFRVMTRVTGDLAPGATVENLTTSYQASWNPFTPGDLTADFDVANTGNTRVRVTGTVSVPGGDTAFPSRDEPQELLAGDVRHFSVRVDGVWPTVVVPGSITVNPEVVVVGGDAPELAPLHADMTAWAIPWPQLIVLVGVALIVASVVWQKGRSKRRLTTLLADAREQGRRSAVDPGRAS